MRSLAVHEVDGFVGQEAVADVAFRQFYSRNARIVLDTHLVVVLVTFLQPAQDGYCREFIWLVYHHRLEPTLERFVLLEVLLILVQRRCTDAAEFATGQCRLQDVGCIHCALASSSTHKSVDLVDKEDYPSVGVGHFLDDTLEPLLEFALIFGAGNECSHVERVELLVLKVLGHVATHYSLRQAFNDCRLTRARLAYQYRIVLGAPGEDLQHAAYLVVTPDDRVKFALARLLHEVLGKLR